MSLKWTHESGTYPFEHRKTSVFQEFRDLLAQVAFFILRVCHVRSFHLSGVHYEAWITLACERCIVNTFIFKKQTLELKSQVRFSHSCTHKGLWSAIAEV